MLDFARLPLVDDQHSTVITMDWVENIGLSTQLAKPNKALPQFCKMRCDLKIVWGINGCILD